MKQLTAILVFAPVLSAFPAFYVRDQQYRFDANDDRCKKDKHCSYEPHIDTASGHSYTLNFIEVKDNGKLFDDKQLDAARNQVRAARANGQQPIVFIYIHGWHNNAGERKQSGNADCAESLYKGDVDKFRNCGLQVVANRTESSMPGATPRIVGIYMAWHGTDFGWPPFYIIPSYPFRRGAARKVGGIGMAQALQGIFDEINKARDSYFVIAMGHSFGARVLETADEIINPDVPEAGIMQKYRANPQAGPGRPPVDIVFYVNAASSHSVSRHTIKDWKDVCQSKPRPAACEKNPLYLAISSRADILTAIVMPIANVVFFAPVTDQYHLISAANTPWMQTHRIPKSVKQCPASESKSSFCFPVPDDTSSTTYYYQVDTKAGVTGAMFWDMNSDHWIASLEGMLHRIPVLRKMIAHHWVISTHGDVWNPGVFNMVSSIIERENLKARGGP